MIFRYIEDIVKQTSEDDFELEDRLHHIVFDFKKKSYEFLHSDAYKEFNSSWGEIKGFFPEVQEEYKIVNYNEIDTYAKDIIRLLFV